MQVLFEKKMNDSSWSKFENMAPWGKIIKKVFLTENTHSEFLLFQLEKISFLI